MGHLINPIALRLGWMDNWTDNFFSELKYYPELFHKVHKIRFVVEGLLASKLLKKSAYIFSHFTIYKYNNHLMVNIYIYEPKGEACWIKISDSLNWFHINDTNIVRNKNLFYNMPDIRRNFLDRRNLLLFIIFCDWITEIDISKFSNNIWLIRDEFFDFENCQELYDNFSKKTLEECNNRNQDYHNKIPTSNIAIHKQIVAYYNLVKECIEKAKLFWPSNIFAIKYNTTLDKLNRLLFLSIFHSFYTKPFLLSLSVLFSFILSYISEYTVKVNFFCFDGNMINAAFFAKYITARLKQGYRVMDVIKPLLNELQLLRKEIKGSLINDLKRREFKIRAEEDQKIFEKQLFVNKFVSKASSRFTMQYKNSKFLFSYMDLIFSYSVYVAINMRDTNGFFNFIDLITLFFSKKILLLFVSSLKLTNNYLNMQIDNWNINTSKLMLSNFLLDYKYTELYSHYFNNYSKNNKQFFFYFAKISSFMYYRLAGLTSERIENYLRFSYSKYQLKRITNEVGINKKKYRMGLFKNEGLIGFKIQMKGRFTRKQIAACFKFINGSIPLSNIKARIDYAFATIPLRNSAVGIKVWFYKRGKDSTYNYRIF